ncbi:MAG: alpha/beta family hydrolase, partial [Planctomycetota bacterium]
KLRETWLEVIEALGPDRLVISGKSMGGRIASLVADESRVAGLVALGYPFHPVGKPDRLRTAHLAEIVTPTLILQGERDPFGTRDEVDGYNLGQQVRVEWIPDGEHSFKPRKSSGRTTEENWDQAIQAFAEFCAGLADTKS